MDTIVVAVRASAELQEDFELVDNDTQVDTDYLDIVLSDWDAAAVDAASQLANEVIVVSVGGDEAETVLREALALGATQAIRITANVDADDPLSIAKLLSAYLAQHTPDLALCGVQSGDHGGSAVPAAVAGYLGWPRSAVVNRVEESPNDDTLVEVARELEAGVTEISTLRLPAVISVQTGQYEHKHPSFMAKRKAATAEIRVLTGSDLGVESGALQQARGTQRIRFRVPPRSATGEKLTGRPIEVAQQILSIVNERLNP